METVLPPRVSGAGEDVLSDPIERAFLEHCKKRFDAHSRLVFWAVLLCNIAWWPIDWVVFPADHVPLLGVCRISLTIFALLYLLLPRPPFLSRNLFWLFALLASFCCFSAGMTAGRVGGPNLPQFHTLYITVFATVPLPLGLGSRVLMTLMLAAATGSGLIAAHPEYLNATYGPMSISFLVFSFLLCSWFGHSQFVLLRANFRQATQLAEHGRLLESRVAERTEELRRLLDHVETAREGERTRISRELHDELGQELSALRYSLGFTKVRYEKEPGAIAANLSDLDDLLRRTTQTTRSLVTDLRPRVIDDLGLGAAVEWLVQRTEQRSCLTCKLQVSGDLATLDERLAIAAFRILQEALTNVVRHAEATEVEVDVQADDTGITLRVKDDGVGIEATRGLKSEATGGVGLVGMRERVQALGGEVSVKNRASERGTEVFCRLPRAPLSGRRSLGMGEVL